MATNGIITYQQASDMIDSAALVLGGDSLATYIVDADGYMVELHPLLDGRVQVRVTERAQ